MEREQFGLLSSPPRHAPCPFSEGEFLSRTAGHAPYYYGQAKPQAQDGPCVDYVTSIAKNFLRQEHIEHEKFLLIVHNNVLHAKLVHETMANEDAPLGFLLPLLRGPLRRFAVPSTLEKGVPRVKPGMEHEFIITVRQALQHEVLNSRELGNVVEQSLATMRQGKASGQMQMEWFDIKAPAGHSQTNRQLAMECLVGLDREAGVPDGADDEDEGEGSDVESPDLDDATAAGMGRRERRKARSAQRKAESAADNAQLPPNVHLKVLQRLSQAGGPVDRRASHRQQASEATNYFLEQHPVEKEEKEEPSIASSSGINPHLKVMSHHMVWVQSQQPMSYSTAPPKSTEKIEGGTAPAVSVPSPPTPAQSSQHHELFTISKASESAALAQAAVKQLETAVPELCQLRALEAARMSFGIVANAAAQKECDRRTGRVRQQAGGDMEEHVWAKAVPEVIHQSLRVDPAMASLLPPPLNDLPQLSSAGVKKPKGSANNVSDAGASRIEAWLERCQTMELTEEERKLVDDLGPLRDEHRAGMLQTMRETVATFRDVTEADASDVIAFADFQLFCAYVVKRPFLVFVTDNVSIRVARDKPVKGTGTGGGGGRGRGGKGRGRGSKKAPAATEDAGEGEGSAAAAAAEPERFWRHWTEEGELDGMLVDAVTGTIVKLFEIKRNPADLTMAIKQRDRLSGLLRDCTDGANEAGAGPGTPTVASAPAADLITARRASYPTPCPSTNTFLSKHAQGMRLTLKPTRETRASVFTLFPLKGVGACGAAFSDPNVAKRNWVSITQRRDLHGELPVPARLKYLLVHSAGDAFSRFLLAAGTSQSPLIANSVTTGSFPDVRDAVHGFTASSAPGAAVALPTDAREIVNKCRYVVAKQRDTLFPQALYWDLHKYHALHNVVFIDLDK